MRSKPQKKIEATDMYEMFINDHGHAADFKNMKQQLEDEVGSDSNTEQEL
jgi:hypothetical protein